MKKELKILGGGPSGLAVGFYAKRRNIKFRIHESSDRIGGNCKTYSHGNFKYDSGAHRFHDKNKQITKDIKLLLGEDLEEVNSPSKIYHNGLFYYFPIQINDIIKNLGYREFFKVAGEILWLKGNKDDISFKNYAYNKYGKTLSNLFLINYTEKLWGRDTNVLDKSIAGDRLKKLTVISTLNKLIKSSTSKFTHYEGSFYYPKDGYGSIFDKILLNIGKSNVNLNSRIINFEHNEKEIINYSDQNKTYYPEHIISTLPLNLMAGMFNPKPPKRIIYAAKKIKFRSLKLFVIFLDTPSISENASIYFPEKIFPFTRIYEPKNRSKHLAPSNQTSIVVEVPFNHDKEIKMKPIEPDEDQYKRICDILEKEEFFSKSQILDHKVITLNNAYPIIEKNIYFELKELIKYFKSFKNLNLIGRNSLFKYVHTHKILYDAKTLVNNI